MCMGYDIAQYSLGCMMRKGRGVPQDYSEAARWLCLAAAQGYVAARFELKSMVAYGRIKNNPDALRFASI
jgi:TPR repeat protein